MINRRYAVLGLVIEQPDYGYRLTQRMQRRLGSMQIERTYVYKLLKGLQDDRLVYRSGEERGVNGSTRVFFAATAGGVEEFAGWMRASAAMMPLYEDLHMKVAFAREEDLPGLIELLGWRERECLALLEEHERLAGRPSGDSGWARSGGVLVRNGDIAHLQTMVGWLQETCVVMRRTVEERRRGGGGKRGPS
ncbi:MAG TPA: helix-turn-helix transcriptional regulator [Solirubrobacteraceae bacterium]|jgi:DNA-binding PadR family transcriptional regulator|nr:helix-turn-helix transcriptional regulator [Solirubrobacteraceae bacterium]